MLLLQMQLLEKLQLLQYSKHVHLAQTGEIQIRQGAILQIQLLLQGVVLLAAADLNLTVLDGLQL